MAEAAVEDQPQQKFYCHSCNIRFENASANYTCPHCAKGFIEELEVSIEPPVEPIEVSDDDDDEPYNMLRYGVDFTELFLQPGPPESRRTGRQRLPTDSSRRRRYSLQSRHGNVRPRTLARLTASNVRHGTPFENLLQEIIFNLGVGPDWVTSGNMQFFLGNPGDYAWGREGLDAIVTQLLNQMDGTGPPPVSKEIIDALPVVEVTNEQIAAKLQCSVCWEDFVAKENVRQLPCQHIYHEPCIRPWLELHGTCPICRQHLSMDGNSDGNQASGVSNAGRNPFEALDSLIWGNANRSNSPSSSTATRGSDSPTSSNSSSSNRDSRM